MKNNYLLALLSALLLWLGWPPFLYTSPLLLIAFIPLLLALENIMRSDLPKKGKKIFLTAGLTCLLWNFSGIYWVFNSMNAIMPTVIAAILSLIPYGLGALLMTLAFRLYYELRKKNSFLVAAGGLASFWIAYEFLHQSWDLSFPWMNLGNGFAGTHQLVQWYEYTGIYGGTLWIWLSNLLLFQLLYTYHISKRTAKIGKGIALWAVLLIAPAALSLSMYQGYEEHVNPSEIVVVQPNVDPYAKYSAGGMSPEAQLENLIRLSDSIAQPNTEFFIWPETAIPEMTNEETILSSAVYYRLQNFLNNYKNGNVLSGIESYLLYDSAKTATARELEGGRFADSFNAAILVENSQRVQFYHKSKLVPGVERMPFPTALSFLKPLFSAFGGTTGGYGSQNEASVFYSQSGIGAAPVICYESIWGSYVGDYVGKGAQFIAIITNDAWWGNTSGKDQHLDYAKLRAIEHRRWIARSANTGISAFINQRGDIVQQSEWWVPDALRQEINLNEEITFYTHNGDYIAYAGSIASLAFLLLIFIKRRKASA